VECRLHKIDYKRIYTLASVDDRYLLRDKMHSTFSVANSGSELASRGEAPSPDEDTS
jgi:hypothetical protein